jgi:hypothetical protein
MRKRHEGIKLPSYKWPFPQRNPWGHNNWEDRMIKTIKTAALSAVLALGLAGASAA